MKAVKIAGIVVGVGVLVAAISLGTVWFTKQHLSGNDSEFAAVSCAKQGASHVVTIQNNAMSPLHTDAKLCDVLTITNTDNTKRLIAFGEHDNHQPYDGVEEKLLGKGESLTVALTKPGTYVFHDHFHDEVEGDFTVTK